MYAGTSTKQNKTFSVGSWKYREFFMLVSNDNFRDFLKVKHFLI